MRIAVAGGTGRIGALVVARLRARGHDVVLLTRREGVDLEAANGIGDRLIGVDAVIDVTNPPVTDVASAERTFTAITENLLSAESRAGVRHHIALSIAGLCAVDGNPHYYGKRAQQRAVRAGKIPFTIVPATQFHDFPAMIADWSTVDGASQVPPLLLQPIAPRDVADVLVEVAEGEPQGMHPDVAGPRLEDAVDMARRTREKRGVTRPLLATWRGGALGVEFAGEVLLPAEGARLVPTTFDEWLESEAAV
ncbi:SDR family oxidoreductase [Microbacterium sp.]|uniref:SDR family oxidoreductase n=1 Tax=Microbacterium sp. TaxID=51671 RepID=UPI0027356A68|nr:SDR family oxidoreductase [Microbacterium sp.]MDP3951950.1 SDR family oxidoreductase [Microbacterium sp.]